MNLKIALSVACLSVAASSHCFAAWTEPTDGAVTDSELVNYLNATKAWITTTQAAGKELERSNGLSGLAVISGMDSKLKEILARNNLTEAEYGYAAGRSWEAYRGLMLEEMLQNSAADLKRQQHHNADDTKRLSETVTADKAAIDRGTRVLSLEQRQSIVDSAKSDQESPRTKHRSIARIPLR